MKKTVFVVLFLLIFTIQYSMAGIIDVRFADAQKVDGNFEVTVQVKSQDIDFEIGSATVFFDYNAEAIGAPAYTPINFSADKKCGPISVYSNNFSFLERETKGEGNYAILLHAPNAGCPTVSGDWVDVARFSFKIKDATKKPNLNFNKKYTAFNKVVNNGEMHTIGNALSMDSFKPAPSGTSDGFVNIFPNYTQHLIQVEFDITSKSPVNINVYDMAGRMVHSEAKAANGRQLNTIDLSEIGSGYFLVEVENAGKKVSEKVLVTK